MTLACPVELRAAGHGHLTVDHVSGFSAATSAEAHAPLKILVPRSRGQSVWAYISNFGGGLLPGDELDVTINVAENARCFLGTQSSTKIFRNGPKGAVQNRLTAEVAAGALLVYTPDVAQSFANSRFQQRQTIRLADQTSSLIFLDWYSSGRTACGERWAFSEYTSRTEIFINSEIAFIDSVHLQPEPESELPTRMARANCIATVAIFGESLRLHTAALLDEISTLPITKRAPALIVASPIPNGLILRAAGVSVEAVAREIFPRLSFIAPLLGDNPFHRKW
jgi:urease accessory protein